jgi:hypothetical protein
LTPPHENFKHIIGQRVGQNIYGSDLRRAGFPYPKNLLSVRELGGGRKEYEYKFRGACRYFYEVDEAGTIIGWRFTGPESDCIIVP